MVSKLPPAAGDSSSMWLPN